MNERAGPCRYVAIDALRFLAAMGVVAYHFAGFTDLAWLNRLFEKNYLFVDFFFVISGFVIFNAYAGKVTTIAEYLAFLKNRIARIYPLHLLTFGVFLALSLTVWRDKPDRDFVDPSGILPNLLLLHAWGTTRFATFNYPSWSISAEWFLYLIFPAVAWLATRGGAALLLIVAALAVGGLEAAQAARLIEPWTTISYHFGLFRAVPGFFAGAALARALPAISLRLKTFVPTWTLFTLALGAMLASLDDRLVVALLALTVAAAVLAERDGAPSILRTRAFARLGDLSYAIYLVHPLVAIACVNLIGLKMLHLADWRLNVWCLFSATVVTLSVAYVVYRHVEVPSRRWIRTLSLPGKRWQSARASEPGGSW